MKKMNITTSIFGPYLPHFFINKYSELNNNFRSNFGGNFWVILRNDLLVDFSQYEIHNHAESVHKGESKKKAQWTSNWSKHANVIINQIFLSGKVLNSTAICMLPNWSHFGIGIILHPRMRCSTNMILRLQKIEEFNFMQLWNNKWVRCKKK